MRMEAIATAAAMSYCFYRTIFRNCFAKTLRFPAGFRELYVDHDTSDHSPRITVT